MVNDDLVISTPYNPKKTTSCSLTDFCMLGCSPNLNVILLNIKPLLRPLFNFSHFLVIYYLLDPVAHSSKLQTLLSKLAQVDYKSVLMNYCFVVID